MGGSGGRVQGCEVSSHWYNGAERPCKGCKGFQRTITCTSLIKRKGRFLRSVKRTTCTLGM